MAKEITKKQANQNQKNVVYIVGAGATQAEISHLGGEHINLMMKDSPRLGPGVSSRIKARTNIDRQLDIQDEVDIEKLISLLAASGQEKYKAYAEDLRKAYFNEIVESLAKTTVFDGPKLAISLLELHENVAFSKIENLSGIISLNHDNLFQLASQKVHKSVNLGFEFQSDDLTDYFKDHGTHGIPTVIQLHGSFNWRNTLPIEVSKLTRKSKYSEDTLWIPPTILKEAKDYPYNKLMGLSYELLTKQCDILRIIGCSLSQNDWNLNSLIFNAQYYQYIFNDKKCFRIELIMDHDTGERIKKEYSYLKKIFSIGYLKDGKQFAAYKDKIKSTRPSEMDNPFKYWIRTKAHFHMKKSEVDASNVGDTLQVLLS